MRIARLAVVTALAAFGCGTSNPTSDGGAGKDGGMDLAAPPEDLAEPADLLAVLPGNRIVSEVGVSLFGITNDGWVIYSDDEGIVFGIKLAGGTPQEISTDGDFFSVSENAVFIWHDTIDPMTGDGPLAVWTSAGGRKELSVAASGAFAAMSADGKWIAYFDKLANGVADLVVDKPDHSAPKTAVTGVDTANEDCEPDVGFAGGRLLLAACPRPATTATVHSIDPATGTATMVAKDVVNYWLADPKNTKVAVVTEADEASIYPIAGGAALAKVPGFVGGFFTTDGSALVYATASKNLQRIAATGGMATTLVTGGVASLEAESPDVKHVAFSSTYDGDPDALLDVRLAGTAAPGMPIVALKDPTGIVGDEFGDAFTDDSSHLLYIKDLETVVVGSDSYLLGGLNAQPTAGGTSKPIAKLVWYAFAANGARVVFNDNYKGVQDLDGRGDIKLVDLAKGPDATLLVTQADVEFGLTTDKKTLVYTWGVVGSRAGLYVAPLP